MRAIKFTLIALVTTLYFQANAQTTGIPGGTILMGGTMGFTASSSSTTANGADLRSGNQFQFSLAPKMGYFFLRNFTAGMSINFSTASRTTVNNANPITGDTLGSRNTESETQLLAGPFFRYYYFPSNRIGIFGELEVGLGAGAVDAGQGQSSSVGQFSFGIGPGLTFFANDMVAIEALAKYSMLTQTTNISMPNNDYKATTNIGKIDFGVGFQFYFNRVIGGQM